MGRRHRHGSALPTILFGSFTRPEIRVGLTLSFQHLASRAAGRRGPCRAEARRYKNNVALPFRAARSLIDVIDTLLPPLASSTCRGALFSPPGNLGCANEHWRLVTGSEHQLRQKKPTLIA